MTPPGPFSVAVFDIDGTLTDQEGLADAEALTEIRRLTERGVTVVISTARGPGGVVRFARGIGDPVVISYQGALVGRFESGVWATDLESTIPLEIAHEIARDADSRKLPTSWHRGDSWWVTERTPEISREEAIVESSAQLIGDIEEIPVAPNKLMFISALGEQRRLGSLRSRLPPDVGHSLSHPNYLEVSPSGVDKGTALVALLDRLAVGHEEVVAFGDGHNDLPMFGVAGRSVAMPHAPSPVLRAADLVATSGLSATIRSLPWIR